MDRRIAAVPPPIVDVEPAKTRFFPRLRSLFLSLSLVHANPRVFPHTRFATRTSARHRRLAKDSLLIRLSLSLSAQPSKKYPHISRAIFDRPRSYDCATNRGSSSRNHPVLPSPFPPSFRRHLSFSKSCPFASRSLFEKLPNASRSGGQEVASAIFRTRDKWIYIYSGGRPRFKISLK